MTAVLVLREVAAARSCFAGGWGTGSACAVATPVLAAAEVLAVDGALEAGGCSGEDVATTDVSAAAVFVAADLGNCDQAIAITAIAASAPPPTNASFLVRIRVIFRDCSIALATEALRDTEAG